MIKETGGQSVEKERICSLSKTYIMDVMSWLGLPWLFLELMFVNVLTPDGSSRINLEVLWNILFSKLQRHAYNIIGGTVKFIIQHDGYPKQTVNPKKAFVKVKKWNTLDWPSQLLDPNRVE